MIGNALRTTVAGTRVAATNAHARRTVYCSCGFFSSALRSTERTVTFLTLPSREQRQRYLGARGAALPDAAVEIGEVVDRLAGDVANDVAELHAGAFGRTAGREPLDGDAVFRLRRVDAEPRPGRPIDAAEVQHVVEDRIDQLARHEHVAFDRLVAVGFLHEQRADADQPAVARRAAPRRSTPDAAAS